MKQFWIFNFGFSIRTPKSLEAFYLTVCALLFALCSAAGAQQPKKMPRVGILRVGSPPDVFIDALRQGLHDAGYIEGQNIFLEYRWLKREDRLVLP